MCYLPWNPQQHSFHCQFLSMLPFTECHENNVQSGRNEGHILVPVSEFSKSGGPATYSPNRQLVMAHPLHCSSLMTQHLFLSKPQETACHSTSFKLLFFMIHHLYLSLQNKSLVVLLFPIQAIFVSYSFKHSLGSFTSLLISLFSLSLSIALLL
jgi:hypothetical protein